MSLDGSTAIVTGAASGIGRGIAQRLAADGAQVVVADVDVDGGEETVDRIEDEGGTAAFVETDITETADVRSLVDATVETFGSLDVLVNNAGGSLDDTSPHAVSDEMLDTVLELNLRGPFVCIREALPHLADGGGSIVTISSVNGMAGIGMGAYSSAKAGLLGLTRVVAATYGRHGIRANAVTPGTIITPATTSEVADESSDVHDNWKEQYPLERFGSADDVAEAVRFLADDETAGWITGVTLPVDGGLTARGTHADIEEQMYDVDPL
jgi:3-oxoacyl-[acyl-carrier protein] reductase